MRKIIAFLHVSLDGFVAGPAGEMNWIKVDEEIFDHIGKRVQQTDAALYGRVTYEMMESYWPGAGQEPGASKHDREHSAWYNSARKIVLSRTLAGTERPHTTIIGDDVAGRIEALRQDAGSEILLFGSPTATHALMALGLIDGYWLFVNPVLLGQGIPLFAGIPGRTPLTLLGTQSFRSGVTELRYNVERP